MKYVNCGRDCGRGKLFSGDISLQIRRFQVGLLAGSVDFCQMLSIKHNNHSPLTLIDNYCILQLWDHKHWSHWSLLNGWGSSCLLFSATLLARYAGPERHIDHFYHTMGWMYGTILSAHDKYFWIWNSAVRELCFFIFLMILYIYSLF